MCKVFYAMARQMLIINNDKAHALPFVRNRFFIDTDFSLNSSGVERP